MNKTSRVLPSSDASEPRRSAWYGTIEQIQRQALLGPAIDSSCVMLDWLRDVRDLMVVELCVCASSEAIEGFRRVKLVYLERVGGFHRSDMRARPLNDVVDDLFRHAEDHSRSILDPDARFLVVATALSSISMRRISSRQED